MKINLQILTLLVSLIAPAAAVSQNTNPDKGKKPGINFIMPNATTTLDSAISIRLSDSAVLFKQFLPLSGRELNKKPIELNSDSRYRMPIMKPATTSKILIAHIDLDFPYQYNMPILKLPE